MLIASLGWRTGLSVVKSLKLPTVLIVVIMTALSAGRQWPRRLVVQGSTTSGIHLPEMMVIGTRPCYGQSFF
jgi:hypothetical protein